MASSPRSPRLRRRVSTFPRSGSIESVGSSCEQLRAPANRGCPDPQPGPKLRDAAQRVARILALEVRTDGQPVRVGRGHVLCGVHCDVDASVEECLFELLDEDAARTDLAERAPAVTITCRRDRHERDLDAGPTQSLCRELGLREREPTAAGTDADQHGTRWA